jgi:hypothetical protein
VSVVIDIVIGFSALVPGKDDIKRPQYEAGHAEGEVKADIRQRLKNDKCENDGRHSP